MHKSVFLIGMMGCGKSTVGNLLAARIHAPFLDLDEEIAAFEGRSIPEIFAAGGDAAFRLCETASLKRSLSLRPRIIATGGGIVTRPENIALMREAGLVIWLLRPLEASIETVRQDTRPNLAGDKQERMRTLFAARRPLYEQAAHITYINDTTPLQAVTDLCALPELRALL